MWREPFPVAGAFDDDLVAGVGQPVQGAVAQDGVIEEAQPFVHGPVAGDDEARCSVPIEDEFVEVGGLLSGQAMETQVIEDEQVGREERSEGAVCRVVHSGLGQGSEEVGGVDETDGVSGADGSVAQGLVLNQVWKGRDRGDAIWIGHLEC